MAGEKIIEKPQKEKIASVPVKIEKPVNLETKVEAALATPAKAVETPKPLEKKGEGNIVAASTAQTYQKQREQAIDDILSEGLNEVFLKMTPPQQKKFKTSGEETVKKINELLNKTKVNVKKIIDLIRKWLKLVPKVNKFFLEQEAKIKADKIMRLKNK
ncbi:MAG: hypothetical protein WC523_02650 [Patescibacteria group bacterium]|jgi:hypothetical protein